LFEQLNPVRKGVEHRPDLIAYSGIGELAVFHSVASKGKHEFRFRHRVHFQIAEYRSQMNLRPHRTGAATRGAENHDRFLAQRSIAGRARSPIDSVLQNTGNRIVVFGSKDEHPISRPDQGVKCFNGIGQRRRFKILVEMREIPDWNLGDGDAGRSDLDSRFEKRAID
jgi:hypothetical protein